MVTIAPHPLLDTVCFVARSKLSAGELACSTALEAALAFDATVMLPSDDVRSAVRTLLRHGGYKPSGRGKPASEYLAGAYTEGRFPRINALVDVCNAVSLHSGLPISLLDYELLQGGLTISVLPEGSSYVFNPSGQTIDASGLLALSDSVGPAGTPVKDAQRTKTHTGTTATLTVIWGSTALPGRAAAAAARYRELLGSLADITVEPNL